MCSHFKSLVQWETIEADESSSGNSQSSCICIQNETTETLPHEKACTSTEQDTAVVSDSKEKILNREQTGSASGEVCLSSSSSSCCRICQDTASESEPLETSKCRCKGHMAKVHRSCLVEWVRYKGSNHCEICNGTFRDVPPPPNLLGVNQLEHLDALRRHLSQFQPLSRRKRTGLIGFIIFLVVASGVSGILTFGADKEFQQVTGDPEASNHELKKAHIVFSICLSLLFFCVTLTLGLILMWTSIEVYFYIQRRRIVQNAARRLIAEIRRRPTATQSTSV